MEFWTSAESRTYAYCIANRLDSVSGGSLPGRAFFYDGDGALRRADENGAAKTRYVTGDYQIDVPTGEATVYYRFLGREVAWRNNTLFRYVLADHLSSSRGEVNADGSEAAQRRFYPFGEARLVVGANDLGQNERLIS